MVYRLYGLDIAALDYDRVLRLLIRVELGIALLVQVVDIKVFYIDIMNDLETWTIVLVARLKMALA